MRLRGERLSGCRVWDLGTGLMKFNRLGMLGLGTWQGRGLETILPRTEVAMLLFGGFHIYLYNPETLTPKPPKNPQHAGQILKATENLQTLNPKPYDEPREV